MQIWMQSRNVMKSESNLACLGFYWFTCLATERDKLKKPSWTIRKQPFLTSVVSDFRWDVGISEIRTLAQRKNYRKKRYDFLLRREGCWEPAWQHLSGSRLPKTDYLGLIRKSIFMPGSQVECIQFIALPSSRRKGEKAQLSREGAIEGGRKKEE